MPLLKNYLPELAERLVSDNGAAEQVEIEIKYEGYMKRQNEQIARFKKMEDNPIPIDFDYGRVASLSSEGRQKLTEMKPENLGQASRISGVTPSDISLVAVSLRSYKVAGE